MSFDERLYSVPSVLIRQRVDIRATATAVEILHAHQRVATHVRSYGHKNKSVIAPEHRPRSHRGYGDWPPERFVNWGRSIGTNVGALIEAMFRSERHPELRYRSALGMIRLAKSYGPERADAACRRAPKEGRRGLRDPERRVGSTAGRPFILTLRLCVGCHASHLPRRRRVINAGDATDRIAVTLPTVRS